jgi:hypothetical protein
MRVPIVRRASLLGAVIAMLATICAVNGAGADAHPLEWRLEQPSPPARVAGEAPATPIGLGRVGDIEFWAPNRGLLITDGNPPTIPAGLWAYNGEDWHELATVCGASEGRIAWAGPDEFWTISDGRPGQAANPQNGEPAPLSDNTLCHFSGGQVVGSYASLAFRPTSYQPMHAAACAGSGDCWFGGDPLPEPQVGAFHLHWNGSSLAAEAGPQGHAVEDMKAFEGRLFESVRLNAGDRLSDAESAEHPSLLHELGSGSSPFLSLSPRSPSSGSFVPAYGEEEFPEALDALRLSADEEALWGAAGPVKEPPAGSKPAAVTVLRFAQNPEAGELGGTELIGPETTPSGSQLFGKSVVNAIGADPSTDSAWLALDSQADARDPSPDTKALVAHVTSEGTTTEELPSAVEGIGPKGAGAKLVCPAENDCWMVSTQGWLFHLSEGNPLPRDNDPAFESLITFRPLDEGIPQLPPDSPPLDDSGLLGEVPFAFGTLPEEKKTTAESKVTVPLLSRIHSRLVRGATLELRFHLAVKARVKLIAKRHGHIVAATSMKTFAAGDRRLLLRLNPRRWPTSLKLEQHALAPLPIVAVHNEGPVASNTVSTSFRILPSMSGLSGTDQLP